jgi:hypothetical protein
MTVVVKDGPPKAPRLLWRVVVGTSGLDPSRPSRPLSWHLASCANPVSPEAHCEEGRRMITNLADADGHCLLNGECPRCAQQATQEQQN